ncbi:receptor-like cytosolic serine/threonine-protein kinase RBK1 isoform X5 [Zingiber officinale]|uniref:receptor-like cytosolic serine/threonine-protein kinase RBK1 isoform X5 n=1 Tax=Zingiber officinale TaxID=94328 RepID=UPI001C4C36C9|nr:receptor-like cytosolic serine/threonine-protein kinase RBK1 isoform X5 [Zingiber officinale]
MKLIELLLLSTELDPEEASLDSEREEQLSSQGEAQKASSITDEEDKNEHNSGSETNSACIDEDSNQSSPRGVLEITASIADSDGGGSSSSSDSSSIEPGPESHSLHWRTFIAGLIMRKKRSMTRLSTFPPTITRRSSLGGALERIKSSSKDSFERKEVALEIKMEGIKISSKGTLEVKMARPSWRSFAYEELAAATDGFCPEKLIGKGGHAEVYKGCLADGQLVAVKRLIKKDGEEERIGDFLSELGIIAHVAHPNAAQLLGFSVEGGLHLVLQFSPHGSLASVLHGSSGSRQKLDWKLRFEIALGIAQGLRYLHEGCQRRIIHRDIKASNILLTEDFQPQISDFGLAKWLPGKWNHHVVFPIEGTFGYLAPEYFMHGVVNEKTDVFAFGVLLLEIVTGRRAIDSSRQSLVIWAKPLLDANNVEELVDASLRDAYDGDELARALRVASVCIHHLSTSRPAMNQVVRFLQGEEGSIELGGGESKERVAKTPLFDGGEMDDDYTCSKYLRDLHRHKQLALEQ